MTVEQSLVSSSSLSAILLLAAMPEEEQALLFSLAEHDVALEPASIGKRLKVGYKHGQVGGCRVVVAQSGVAAVNAALAAGFLVEELAIEAVILLGVGGSLHSDLALGDVVIADHVMQHDSFSSLASGMFWMQPGHYILSSEQADDHQPMMATDPTLSQWLLKAAHHAKAHRGTLLSGAEFVGLTDRKQALAKLVKNALLVDMEAAGIAQVCSRMKVPYAVAKTVSDRLLPDGTVEGDFQKTLQSAAAMAAEVVSHVVLQLRHGAYQ
jgi:adenosylhomocysteine nucleosidase